MTTLKKIAAAVCAAACIASVSAAPDDISKLNPYGLVYQGAVKTNTAGEVNIHPVTYKPARHQDRCQRLYAGQLRRQAVLPGSRCCASQRRHKGAGGRSLRAAPR